MCFQGREAGKIIWLWWSLLTTIVIRLVFWMALYKALYRCRCISTFCEDVVGEHSIVGPDWVQQTHDKVCEI